MKTSKTTLLIVMLTFFASILYAQTSETRNVGTFNAIRTGGSWNVILEKGDREEVRLETKNFDLNKVITEVKRNTLHITLENGNHKNVNFTVYVTYTDLKSIKSGGSGDIRCDSELVADRLEISVSGSGDGRFQNIRGDKLQVSLNGTGNVDVAGGAIGSLIVKHSGSGNFRGMNLEAQEAEVNTSGSGDISFTANNTLSVRSSGSGNVEYKGNPEFSDVRFSGSGKAVKK